MTDALQPKKRMGRPPKHVGHGKRPAVQLRVRESLYNEIARAAEENGRSLSEEMESRVEYAFSDAIDTRVKLAELGAKEAAEKQITDEIEEEFGGKRGLFIMSALADIYKIEVRKAIADGAGEFAVFSEKSRRDELASALSNGIPAILAGISAMPRLMDTINENFAQLEAMRNDDPAGYEALKERINQMIAAHKSKKPTV